MNCSMKKIPLVLLCTIPFFVCAQSSIKSVKAPKTQPSIDTSVVQLNPLKPYPGLSLSSENFDQNRIRELKQLILNDTFKRINGIVVIKNGKLLIEEYFNGGNRDSLHNPRSVGKSFTSTIMGIAIGDGYLKNEQQLLGEFYDLKKYAHYSAAKDSITLRQLLTMSSSFDGFDFDMKSPGNEENMYPTENWAKFALDLPVSDSIPRGQWHYFTAGVVVLGDILHRSVPGGLEKYAHQKLFGPMQIKYRWQYTPQNIPNTAGGIQLNALDFAKYGLLYKNKGKWNGKQLVPASWIEKSLSKQLPVYNRPGEYYGYLFWNKQYQVNGKQHEVSYCSGNGGNKIFIFKNQPLVIVITASAYNQRYAHSQADKIMTEYILPAVVD